MEEEKKEKVMVPPPPPVIIRSPIIRSPEKPEGGVIVGFPDGKTSKPSTTVSK